MGYYRLFEEGRKQHYVMGRILHLCASVTGSTHVGPNRKRCTQYDKSSAVHLVVP